MRAGCEHASNRRTPAASAGLVRLMGVIVNGMRSNDPCRKSCLGVVTRATCALAALYARMRASSNTSEADMRHLLLLCLVLSVPVLASDRDNIVKIDSGYVLGSGTDVRVYKGI